MQERLAAELILASKGELYGGDGQGKQMAAARATDHDVDIGGVAAKPLGWFIATGSLLSVFEQVFGAQSEGIGIVDAKSTWPIDGFRIAISESFSQDNLRFGAFCLGGSSITNVDCVSFQLRTTPGTQTVTLGFQPTCLIFLSTDRIVAGDGASGGAISFGWATGTTTGSMMVWTYDSFGSADAPLKNHRTSTYISP